MTLTLFSCIRKGSMPWTKKPLNPAFNAFLIVPLPILQAIVGHMGFMSDAFIFGLNEASIVPLTLHQAIRQDCLLDTPLHIASPCNWKCSDRSPWHWSNKIALFYCYWQCEKRHTTCRSKFFHLIMSGMACAVSLKFVFNFVFTG